MKKIGLFFIASCLSLIAMAQNTVDIFSTGALGSFKSGSATASSRTDNTIICNNIFGAATRGYGVFNLGSIPASAVITSVELHFNVESVTPGGGFGWTTRGCVGDLSTITSAATLFSTTLLGTSIYTTSYGTTAGNKVIPTAAAAETFITSNLGGMVSIVWSSNTIRTYSITGETGVLTTSGAHAPFLRITYNCPGITSLTATGPAATPCPNIAFGLTGTATGTIASYAWTGPLGFTSTMANPTVTTGLPSTGNYTLTVTDATGCSSRATVNVPVFPAPSTLISPLTPTAFCAAGNCTLDAAVVAGSTYQWYDNGTPIAGATDASYTTSVSGNYKVEVTDLNGCTATTAAGTPTVLLDTPAVSPADTILLCNGDNTTVSVNTNGVTSGVSFQWQKNGTDIPGSISNNYLVSTSGIYRCKVSVPSTTCSTVSRELYVQVNSYPIPVISSTGSTLSTANTYSQYQWFLNTVAITGATNNSYTPTLAGSYRVRVTDIAGCSAYSVPFSIFTTSVADVNKGGVKIYPNPVKDQLHIEAPYVVDAVICGVEGKVIGNYKNASLIDLRDLPTGLYIITFFNTAGERVGMEKIVRQ
jgi:hypothetical protein